VARIAARRLGFKAGIIGAFQGESNFVVDARDARKRDRTSQRPIVTARSRAKRPHE
jgi:hypothetical protein